MSHRSLFISATLSVLLLSFSARSQEPASAAGADESATVVRKKAIELLGSVAGQVNGLHSAENRARIGSNVADMLWEHDEKRARGLFAAVEEDIKATFYSIDEHDEGQMRTLMVFLQLRSNIIDRIARHDPDLALEFLRATPPMSETSMSHEMRASEKSIALRLARQVTAKNPQLALKIGRESLANGFSTDLVALLSHLQHRDKEAALNLFKDIVAKLKSANLAQDWMANVLAVNLAQSFQPPDADEQVYRDLIGVVVASALTSHCADAPAGDNWPIPICIEIGSVFSRIETYYPQRAVALKRWDAQSTEQLSFPRRFLELVENGTVDEILALAPRYPALQGQIYRAAMIKAEASGEVARARQIASDSPDEEDRRRMLAQLDRDRMWTSVNEEKLAAIQEDLSRLHSSEERMQLLLNMASRIGGNDRKAAIVLLNQAVQIIDSINPGKAQIEGQITLAVLYCSLKNDRGFAIMESVIPKLNELVAAAATLDGFENRYLRDGEWNMTGEGVLGGLLTHLAQSAGYFAALDFDRSVNLASQLERPELRLMAQEKIAQAILTGQVKAPTILQPTSEAMP